MQSDMAKWSGLAGALAAAAQWTDLETLLSMLSQQAAAGARAELLPLMQVWVVSSARVKGREWIQVSTLSCRCRAVVPRAGPEKDYLTYKMN